MKTRSNAPPPCAIALAAVSLAFATLVTAHAQSGLVANPDFEPSGAVTNGWELSVYGATPHVERDTGQVRAGRGSLRAGATEPSDTALGQEVALKPLQWYRFTGWVRTRGLAPTDATVFGTLQVQRAGGAGTLASGANHGGDTEWTNVVVHFQAPPDGRVRLCLFFAGFGKGTGTAWFDELTSRPCKPGLRRAARASIIASPPSP